MAKQRRELSPQIIVAVIGLTGVISAALIGNWDKLFSHKAQPTPVPSAPAASSDAKTEAVVVNRMGAATEHAYGAAADALEDVGRQIDAASGPTLVGAWHDSEGYRYLFDQQGRQFQYRMMQGGNQLSTGRGRIEGRTLRYAYSGEGGNGSCQGELAAGDAMISGRCSDAETGKSWHFQLDR
jgi:hypothetical protein